jgi:methionyl-tRNA formyltransferase
MSKNYSTPLRLAVAGSTEHSRKIAEKLAKNQAFELIWVLTPPPKKVGRQQLLTINPLALWAKENKINTFLVPDNLKNLQLKKQIREHEVDLLLVVDFGYFIPDWLLDFPKIETLNIHPSLLPRWRGSSPGQFATLFTDFKRPWNGQLIGGKETAVTLMTVKKELDSGDIISQKTFDIDKNWTLVEYYQNAFQLINQSLAENILKFIEGKLKAVPQKKQSPTPFAQRLDRADTFVAWSQLKDLLKPTPDNKLKELEDNNSAINIKKEALLAQLLAGQGILGNYPLTKLERLQFVNNACRAFQPWPGLWTIAPTRKGEQRLKILTCKIKKNKNGKYLLLQKVQLAGKNPCLFSELKNLIDFE